MRRVSGTLNPDAGREQFVFISDEKSDMLDWWVGTVILTFFPILVSIVISLCRSGSVDVNRMVGDGELILSAFLVIAPSIMNYYKTNTIEKGKYHKLIFYLLLFVAFFNLRLIHQ